MRSMASIGVISRKKVVKSGRNVIVLNLDGPESSPPVGTPADDVQTETADGETAEATAERTDEVE